VEGLRYDTKLLDLYLDDVVKAMEIREFADMTEVFQFDEQSLDYLDGPLSGWLLGKTDGTWYAFDCQPILPQLVWHWTLVAVAVRTDVLDVLEQAEKNQAGSWFSVVEDRRGPAPSCRLVQIANVKAAPVVFSARAREREPRSEY
jgi:hypothetical protein